MNIFGYKVEDDRHRWTGEGIGERLVSLARIREMEGAKIVTRKMVDGIASQDGIGLLDIIAANASELHHEWQAGVAATLVYLGYRLPEQQTITIEADAETLAKVRAMEGVKVKE